MIGGGVQRPRGQRRAADAPADFAAANRLGAALALHQAGRLTEAQASYDAILAQDPGQPDALHLSGLLAHQRGDHDTAIRLIDRALRHRPHFPIALNNLGGILRTIGRGAEAVALYARALEMRPELVGAELGLAAVAEDAGDFVVAATRLTSLVARDETLAPAWLALGRVRRLQHDLDGAIAALERATALVPAMFAAHNELGIALLLAGRWSEAAACYERALLCDGEGAFAMRNLGHTLKRAHRLDEAVACYRFASAHRFLHCALDPAARALATYATTSRTKLAHDAAQLRHLGQHERAVRYDAVLALIADRADPTETVRLTAAERAELGDSYNRRLHVADAPRLDGNPLGAWDPVRIETAYLGTRPELVVIDDFLSAPALDALRRYCLDSTVWHDFSHRDGYLAAFLDDGLDCPLLLQIAEALRAALPRLLAPHPLIHAWAYKYDTELRGIGVHGDDAAVNVNFWITQDAANLDPDGGGMIVYPALAPADWRFADFNADAARIDAFLAAQGGTPQRIAYRANRAVVFNSSLFHETDRFRFASGYADRRINVTMLFGERR